VQHVGALGEDRLDVTGKPPGATGSVSHSMSSPVLPSTVRSGGGRSTAFSPRIPRRYSRRRTGSIRNPFSRVSQPYGSAAWPWGSHAAGARRTRGTARATPRSLRSTRGRSPAFRQDVRPRWLEAAVVQEPQRRRPRTPRAHTAQRALVRIPVGDVAADVALDVRPEQRRDEVDPPLIGEEASSGLITASRASRSCHHRRNGIARG
jgi:hypothetical protein